MIYTTYNPSTGQIYSTVKNSETVLPESTADIGILPGEYSGKKYWVVSDTITELPTDPSSDSLKYRFDYVTGAWQLDTESSKIIARVTRNKMLEAIDRINPIWYASLNTDQQQELITYRQALLAVPQQSGFPETVTWPVKPTWLS